MRNVVLPLALCALVGCATKEMKSTPFYSGGGVEYAGQASDRVNLWPIAYWRDPVGSVAWPIVSFSNDHFALRPIYSQYKQTGKRGAWDEFNFLWPFAQFDLREGDGRVFPYCWGKSRQTVFPLYWNGPDYNALLPLWYYGADSNRWTFNTLAGLAGARRMGYGYRCSWAFPLWFEDSDGLFATLLYGQTPSSRWLFPLWYKGERAFVSPLWAQGEDGGGHSWWASPLTLSWGSATTNESDGTLLFALGGWHVGKDANCENGRWWAWPFADYVWSVPTAAAGNLAARTETYSASRLVGLKTKNGKLSGVYAFPLFGWSDDGSALTPLGGRNVHADGGVTNKFVTPFFGVTSGKRTGGWAFPLWNGDKCADFDQKAALIDSPTLPDCIEVSVATNGNSAAKGATRLVGKRFWANDKTTVAIMLNSIRTVGGSSCHGAATNSYTITETHRRGNKLLLDHKRERKVRFDLKTRAKLSDAEESQTDLALYLYNGKRRRDRISGDETATHRVLWRLWNWEEGNGDVSLDAFPGFTYDSRRDGYSKASFLWRFFRHEREPDGGTSVDFLFLPVWR